MWPSWCNRLPASSCRRLAEGGQRLSGRYQSGTTEKPLVSYITVVKNNASLLPRALDSAQHQTYSAVEHIVIDGASTDGTLDILHRYKDLLAYYVSEPDNGIYHAMNRAIPLARGSIICILNSDDWLEQEAAAIAAEHLAGEKNALLASAAIVPSGVWRPSPVHSGTYFSCMDVCHNGIYVTRDVYESSGPYDESYAITADFKWVMTCFDKKVTFFYTDQKTVHFSAGGASNNLRLNALDTVRVIHDRFDFLEEKEIHCLYYCFYKYIAEYLSSLSFKPSKDPQVFIDMLTAHKDKKEFISALGWALWEKASLQSKQRSTQASPSGFFEAIRTLLRGTPLFGPCRQTYHTLKRILSRF